MKTKTMYERCMEVMPAVAGRATTLGIVNSDDSYIFTEDGRKILDFASGVAVNNLGNRNPEIIAAIEEQLKTMVHVGHNVVYYESYVRLAEKLVEMTGGNKKVYFSNSGAEANEGAIKLAKYVTKRPQSMFLKDIEDNREQLINKIEGIEYVTPMSHCLYDFIYELDDDIVEESISIEDVLSNSDQVIDREISVTKVVG